MLFIRNLLELTNEDDQLSRLIHQAQYCQRLDKAFKKHLPSNIAARCQAVRINHLSQLIIFADNSTTAARLRLMAPEILSALNSSGFLSLSVKINVKPKIVAKARQNRLKLSAPAKQALEHLAQQSSPELASSIKLLLKKQFNN